MTLLGKTGGVAPLGFSMVDTAVGWCAVAWSAIGICAVQLPEAGREATRQRMVRRLDSAAEEATPTAQVHAAMHAITTLLRQGRADLTAIALDLDHVSPFNRQVYDIALRIAPGDTRTYGQIATDMGDVNLSRAVGRALGQNPIPIIVPCHRVIAANGNTGGFSGGDGVATKMRLLGIEGAAIAAQGSLFT